MSGPPTSSRLLTIISAPPPFDPPVEDDAAREARRRERETWLKGLPEADPREKQVDYGRPLMRLGSEEKLCEALSSIRTPVLILGGTDDHTRKRSIHSKLYRFRTASA